MQRVLVTFNNTYTYVGRVGPRDCVPGSECLMHTRSIHAKACMHVINMLSQHINKVKWPPCRKTSKKKNAVTLERSFLREIRDLKIFAFSTKPIAVIKVLYKHLIEPENSRHTHTK